MNNFPRRPQKDNYLVESRHFVIVPILCVLVCILATLSEQAYALSMCMDALCVQVNQ